MIEEEQSKEFKDYIDALRRHRTAIVYITLALLTITVLVAVLLPPVYRSAATILIEEQEIPPDFVRSTVTSYASQRIQIISQRVMSRNNLLEVIEKYNLYPWERKRESTEEVLERARKDINLNMISANVIDPRSGSPMQATIAFTVSFDASNPAIAQKVANELTSLYLNENLRSRTEKTAETYTFLSEEANRLGERISELETHLAKFKQKNAPQLPELKPMNMQMAERTREEIKNKESELRVLEERKFYLEAQLAVMSPYSPSTSSTGAQVLDPVSRLKTLRSEYINAAAKYSPEHPNVLSLRREIDALEKQVGPKVSKERREEDTKELTRLRDELSAAQQRYSEDHPDVIRLKKTIDLLKEQQNQPPKSALDVSGDTSQPDNPGYIALKSQLLAVNRELQEVPATIERLKTKLVQYEQRLLSTPEVEREYLTLLRDYENSVARYREIKAKQMQAQVAQELEKERKGERFSLIDPPQMPEQPVSPNRPAILVLGFILSLAGGFGYAAVAESLDSSIRGVRGVTSLLNAPPLSVIPYMQNNEETTRTVKIKRRTFAAFAASLVLIVILAHLLWTPLDVLWFRGLRKVDNVLGP